MIVHPLWVRSFLPAVGPLFPPWLLSSLVLLWTPRCSRLTGTVSASPASPLASAELTLPVQCEALFTSRSWLSLHVLTYVFFSACSLTCCASARSLTCCAWSGCPQHHSEEVSSPLQALCVEVGYLVTRARLSTMSCGHSCASPGRLRRWSLCLKGLCRKRRSTPFVGFAQLCFQRSRTVVHCGSFELCFPAAFLAASCRSTASCFGPPGCALPPKL